MAEATDTTDPDFSESSYKVRLVSAYNPRFRVVFSTSPTFSEARSVDYSAVTPVHMPGSIQVYKHTNSRSFSMTARLISRTIEEATTNMMYLQMLRSWTLPFFGSGSSSLTTTQQQTRSTAQRQLNDQNRAAVSTPASANSQVQRARQDQGVEILGAPPEVLYLYAYSSVARSNRSTKNAYVNINKVPVVLSSLNITYPDDVDYIPTLNENEPFPVRMEVSMELLETHSPTAYSNFSLTSYKLGQLKNF